jgi:hypothetical protein
MRNKFLLFISICFFNLIFGQINKNSLSFSNSINSVYKRNLVYKSFDELYGKAIHTELNLMYARNILNSTNFSFDIGININCEYLRYKYYSKSYSKNWYIYPGLTLKTAYFISPKTSIYLQGNQCFSGIFLQQKKNNSYKSNVELDDSFKVFSKADILVGVSYQFLQKENYQLGFNLAFGANLYTYTDEFFYRYYTNYGVIYSF